jgi:hypothetical protein
MSWYQITGRTALVCHLEQGLTVVPSDLLRVTALITSQLQLRVSSAKKVGVSERRRAAIAAAAAGELGLGRLAPTALLVTTVSLTYCTLNPRICLAALAYFAMGVLVYRYNVLFVHGRKKDSGGLLWRAMAPRLVAALVVAQVSVMGSVGTRGSLFAAITLLPLPVASVALLTHLFKVWAFVRCVRCALVHSRSL